MTLLLSLFVGLNWARELAVCDEPHRGPSALLGHRFTVGRVRLLAMG